MQIGCFAISSATLGFAALSPTYAQPTSAAVLFFGAPPRAFVERHNSQHQRFTSFRPGPLFDRGLQVMSRPCLLRWP